MIGIPNSISNPAAEFGAPAGGGYHDIFRDLDEEDPLGLLVPNDSDGANKNKRTSLSSCLISGPPPGTIMVSSSGPETTSSLRVAAADCCDAYDNSGDPLEFIDAVLRSSRAVRERVSSRQVSWN